MVCGLQFHQNPDELLLRKIVKYFYGKFFHHTPRKERHSVKEWAAIDKWRNSKNLYNGFVVISAATGERIVHCNVYKTGQSFKALVWLPGCVVGCGKSKTYGGAVQSAFENAGATLVKDLPFNYISVCAEEAAAFAKAIFNTDCHTVLFAA